MVKVWRWLLMACAAVFDACGNALERLSWRLQGDAREMRRRAYPIPTPTAEERERAMRDHVRQHQEAWQQRLASTPRTHEGRLALADELQRASGAAAAPLGPLSYDTHARHVALNAELWPDIDRRNQGTRKP